MKNLREHAVEIWNAGVASVRPTELMTSTIRVEHDDLWIGDQTWSGREFDRIIVVGAGKAATGMAAGLVDAIGDWRPISGWVNVPAGTDRPVPKITIHVARPAGVNEPTPDGVEGTEQILKLVGQAGPRDLCVALISGGGSALLPAPTEGITLEDKLAVTRLLSSAGADITQLNTVRKHLSRIKGGGLLAACRAGRLVTVILSDVLGDPLDLIASGPTVADTTTAADALAILRQFDLKQQLPESVYQALLTPRPHDLHQACPATTMVIGNNAVAVDQAGIYAESLGYNHVMHSSQQCEGAAEDVGQQLARMTIEMLNTDPTQHRNDCLITGGEPIVKLAPEDQRGRGGRNQQLVLAAYRDLRASDLPASSWDRLAILSGGTDGEDGPTDAAGAVLDGAVHRRALEIGLDVDDHLRRNDAYTFFHQCDGLLKTGPTGTNVCDLRVAVVDAHRPNLN